MAASYQTGTASSPSNLLQTLSTWLAAQGWTVNADTTDGAGRKLHVSKNGLFLNFRSAVSETIWAAQSRSGHGIGLYAGDGYSGAAAWNAQSGAPVASGTSNVVGASVNLPSGAIVAYHFFDDGADHIVIVIEKAAGLFVHMGWGPSLVKIGYTTDFPYFFGSTGHFYTAGSSSTLIPGADIQCLPPFGIAQEIASNAYCGTFFRVDATTFSGRWVGITGPFGTTNTNVGFTGRIGRGALNLTGSDDDPEQFPDYSAVVGLGWQSLYPGALLLPLHAFVFSPAGRPAPVGYPPTVFFCEAVGHGFASAEVLAVGGVNYMLFPNFAVKKAA